MKITAHQDGNIMRLQQHYEKVAEDVKGKEKEEEKCQGCTNLFPFQMNEEFNQNKNQENTKRITVSNFQLP